MTDTVSLVPALVAGVLLGMMFFGGLWWSIQKGLSSTQPALWFLGSLLLRASMTLVGFYAVSVGHWDRLFVCLLGFLIARFIVTRLTGPPAEHHNSSAKEAGHAS